MAAILAASSRYATMVVITVFVRSQGGVGMRYLDSNEAAADICLPLLGDAATASERELGIGALVPNQVVDHVRDLIAAGQDPLGTAYMETSASAFRRPNGETYTPASMVEGMLSWVAEVCQPERVVDCDCGSGRFAAAAARAFPRAKVIVIDSPPLSALMCRAHARDITGEDEAYRRAELLPRLIVLPECIDELSAADVRIAERIVWEGVEEGIDRGSVARSRRR